MNLRSKIVLLFAWGMAPVACVSQTAPISKAPAWFQVAQEGDTINLATGALLQACGSDAACTAVATPKDTTVVFNWRDGNVMDVYGNDPLPNSLKLVGIIQTCAVQSVTVNGNVRNVPAKSGCSTTPLPTSKAGVTITPNDAAILITDGPQVSLTPDETQQLQAAMYEAEALRLRAAEAMANAKARLTAIVNAHHVDATKPYQLVYDSSWSFSYVPTTSK